MTHNPSKLRLVRCPKCDHLLPELPAYSVYLCGGCGAYLKDSTDRKPTLLELIDRSSLSWESAATADAAAADSMAYREGGADVDRRGRTPERRYYQENDLALPVRVSKSPIRSSRAEDSTEGSEFGGFARADPRYKPSPPRSVRSGAASRISSPMKGRASPSKSPVRSLRGGREPTPTRERDHMEDTAPYRSPSKSPVRRGTTEGGGFGGFSSSPHRTSPVRSARGGGEGFKKSPARDDGVVDEYYATHKSSPVRSVRRGKSPMRDRTSTGHNSPNKSPARSVRGGFAKSPARSTEREGTPSPLRQRDLGNPEQMPADEKVGAWMDQAMIGKVVEEEQSDGRGNPLFQQKINSFGDWLDSDLAVVENPQQPPPQQPPPRRRGSKSPRNRRQWRVDEPPIPETEEVYNHTTIENQYQPEVDDLYTRRRMATEVHHGGRRGSVPRRYRGEGRVVEEEVRYVDRDQYERVARRRYPPDIYYEKPRISYESSTAGSHDSAEIGRAELYRKCIELQAQILLMDGSDPPPPPPIRSSRPVPPSQSYHEFYAEDHLRARSPYHNPGRSRSPYNAGCPDFIPYARGPPETVLLNMPPYEDEDQALSGTPNRVAAQYYHPRPQPEPGYVLRRSYMEQPPAHLPFNQYHLPRENPLHHPNCHCPRCQVSTLHAQAHPQAAASSGGGIYHHRRSSSSQTEPLVSAAHHPDPRAYNPRFSNSSPHMKSTPAGVVTASEDSSGSTQPHNRRRRNTTTLPKTRVCRPVAGAAPFVVCVHCSELLKLPKKVRAIKNSTLKCGSCSSTLEFDLEMKMMIPHDPISPQFNCSSGTMVAASTVASYNEPLPLHSKHGSGSSGTMVKDSEQPMLDESVEGKSLQDSLAGGLSSESYTVDKLYTFPSSGSEASLLLEELRRRKSNPEAAAEKQQQVLFPASSSHASKELEVEQPPMNLNEAAAALEQKRNTTTTTPSPPLIGKNLVRPPPGSPLREHIDYSNILKQGVADGGGILRRNSIESNSSSSDESEGFAKGDPNPMANSAHSRVSSTDTTSSGEKDDPESVKKTVSGGRRVFPDINGQQGFENSSVSSSMTATATTGKADVFVNGQPISQRKVKSAEGLAGPISPGDYWYDSRAGFWGVMGRHCLGIIPPFIPEFVFPMPVNCAGGNTEIYVNGRELHESDLDVLASRRLPRTKNKLYRIDITGRVEIEHTGEFVCELGRLAPSVEKNRCGFGMSTPYTD